MKNKIIISTLLLVFSMIFLSSYSFATNNTVQSARNTIMNAGNAVGNVAEQAGNGIVNGVENLGNDIMGGVEGMTSGSTAIMDSDYTATRTATTSTTGNGLFGMSYVASTWLILGTIGAIIVGLVWYYGAQFEHKNYNND